MTYTVLRMVSIMNMLCLLPMLAMVMAKLKCAVIQREYPELYNLSR